jgi:hypothetical protein
MRDILHRFTIDAPRGQVHELVATSEGVERWWTGHPNTGDGSAIGVCFSDGPQPQCWTSSRTPPSGSSGASATVRFPTGQNGGLLPGPRGARVPRGLEWHCLRTFVGLRTERKRTQTTQTCRPTFGPRLDCHSAPGSTPATH